jgi:SM-20-related protein
MTTDILDLAPLHAAPLVTEPFPFLTAQNVIRAERIAELARDFPPLSGRGLYPADGLALGPAMQRLVAEIRGEELRTAIEEKFGLDLRRCPPMITLRGHSTERDGHIHSDSDDKAVTLLLYLNEHWPHNEGNLRLLRSRDDLESTIVEIPSLVGSLLIFKVTPNGWHGHHRFVGERRVLMANYMVSEAALRRELGRHRFSAKVKDFRRRLGFG